MNHEYEGSRKCKPLSSKEVTPLSRAYRGKKGKRLQKSSKSMELHCMLSNPPDFFLSFHHIAQLSKCRKLTLTDTVREQAAYLLCKHMVFHISPKSLISLTPFPKIVQPFAYLQCDNTAV